MPSCDEKKFWKVFAVQVECLFSITLFGQRVELVKMYFLLSVVARKLWVQCWPPTLLANSQFAIRCWQKILFNVFLTHKKCCSQCLSFIGWRRALISRQTDVVVASRKRLYSTAMMTTLTTDASPSLKVDVAQNCSRGQNQILPFENHPEELQLSLRWQQKTVKLSHLLKIQNVFLSYQTSRAIRALTCRSVNVLKFSSSKPTYTESGLAIETDLSPSRAACEGMSLWIHIKILFVRERAFDVKSVWPYFCIICSIFGHLQQWKFTQ